MELRKGSLLPRSSAYIAGGTEGLGRGTAGLNKLMQETWSGGNQAACRVIGGWGRGRLNRPGRYCSNGPAQHPVKN
jgi:hypothetical protein